MEEKMLQIFKSYVDGFDFENERIKLKYEHSLKVMEISERIARSLFCYTEEEINVIKIIGLFHDLGRFPQIKEFDTFDDNKSFDHAGRSVEVLFDSGMIKNLDVKLEHYEIIKTAIYYHNKYEIPDYIDEKTKGFCKIIRDADKIDIFRVIHEVYKENKQVETYPSQKCYEEFKNYKPVNHKNILNDTDRIMCSLALIFDINYKYSFSLLNDSKVVSHYIASLEYKNNELKNFFNQIKMVLDNYIEKGSGRKYVE